MTIPNVAGTFIIAVYTALYIYAIIWAIRERRRAYDLQRATQFWISFWNSQPAHIRALRSIVDTDTFGIAYTHTSQSLEITRMKIEKGQVWQDDSTKIEVEITRASFDNPVIGLQEIDKPDTRGTITASDLYQYFTFLRWKDDR